PEQKIRLVEALGCYTSRPAWQNRAEQWKGTVSVGKVADLCVLDRNLLRSDPARLPQAEVVKTMIDGGFVYEA
ncbi:MAG: amidohydrolase family protein, partial [Renibacterium salmoninarum]|nr:amidohydrolase family protein [Renibacterium salmoninarum]